MKTSYYLLLAAVLITLTGMVATDVFLKQEYEKINWSDNYQFFARRSLPEAKHIVIDGTANREILVESGAQAQAFIAPADSLFFHARMRHDTLYVSFNPDTTDHDSPSQTVWNDRPIGLLVRLPALESVHGVDTRLTIQGRVVPVLNVSLTNSVLFARQLGVSSSFRLTEGQNSFALLDKGSYKSVQLMVQDSSVTHIRDARMDAFTPTLSDKAEVQFKGQSVKWIK